MRDQKYTANIIVTSHAPSKIRSMGLAVMVNSVPETETFRKPDQISIPNEAARPRNVTTERKANKLKRDRIIVVVSF